jgi:hypothetical protein
MLVLDLQFFLILDSGLFVSNRMRISCFRGQVENSIKSQGAKVDILFTLETPMLGSLSSGSLSLSISGILLFAIGGFLLHA